MRLFTVVAIVALFTCAVSAHSVTPQANRTPQNDYTPLMRAAMKGQVNEVRALLRKGAKVDEKHPAGLTALMVAAGEGKAEVVKVLLNAGANPNVSVQTPHAGEITLLSWAVLSRNLMVVQSLVKAGAEVNPRTRDGSTPLMMAVNFGSVPMIKTLLAGGADVNFRIFNGYTALMVASDRHEPAIARILIAAGADVNAKNNFGETALYLAMKEENSEVVAVLKRAGAK